MTDRITADEARRLREAATEGPWWLAEPSEDGTVQFVCAGERYPQSRLGHIVTQMDSGYSAKASWDQRRADHALIAAAPDLASEVERLSAEREKLREAVTVAVANLHVMHLPMWASDEMKARGKDPLGCSMCWPKDGGWPCADRIEADDLAAALSPDGDKT